MEKERSPAKEHIQLLQCPTSIACAMEIDKNIILLFLPQYLFPVPNYFNYLVASC